MVMTKDRDFIRLLEEQVPPPQVIWLRLLEVHRQPGVHIGGAVAGQARSPNQMATLQGVSRVEPSLRKGRRPVVVQGMAASSQSQGEVGSRGSRAPRVR